jgi:hypothetical protein
MAARRETVAFRLTEVERKALEAVAWHHSGDQGSLSEFLHDLVMEIVTDYLDENGRGAVLHAYLAAKDQEAQTRREEELRLLTQAMAEDDPDAAVLAALRNP